MSLIPEFTLGIANGWWFLLPYLVIMIGQPMLYPNRKEVIGRLMCHPRKTRKEKIVGSITVDLYYAMLIYSIFLPLKLHSLWFWSGLAVFVAAMIVYMIAVHNFAVTPLNQPIVHGIYRISRHPIHFFSFVAWIGIGLATASWVLLLVNVISMLGIHVGTLTEEKFCLEKYGDSYRKYMKTTSRYFLFF